MTYGKKRKHSTERRTENRVGGEHRGCVDGVGINQIIQDAESGY